MSEELVTVVMPAYNSASYIERAIKSVLSQTHANLELLIIDDASTDDTVDVCHRIIKDDQRAEMIVRPTNGGGAVSRNAGIDAATGPWIAFLDADDEWFPTKIERQLAFMLQQKADVSYTGYEREKVSGVTLSQVRVPHAVPIHYDRLIKRNIIGCSTAMVRRTFLGDSRFPNLRKRQDYGLWLTLAKRRAKIVGLDECLARYHLRPDSVSANRLEMVKYNWKLYRECEKLGVVHAAWLVVRNAIWVIKRRIFGA